MSKTKEVQWQSHSTNIISILGKSGFYYPHLQMRKLKLKHSLGSLPRVNSTQEQESKKKVNCYIFCGFYLNYQFGLQVLLKHSVRNTCFFFIITRTDELESIIVGKYDQVILFLCCNLHQIKCKWFFNNHKIMLILNDS